MRSNFSTANIDPSKEISGLRLLLNSSGMHSSKFQSYSKKFSLAPTSYLGLVALFFSFKLPLLAENTVGLSLSQTLKKPKNLLDIEREFEIEKVN